MNKDIILDKTERHDKITDNINAVLHQRAAKLSEIIVTSDKTDETQIIEFNLGPECYGIESKYVSSVCKSHNMTRLPNVPDYIDGIVNIHGFIACVVNFKILFGLPQSDRSELNRILIVNHDNVCLGIMVDEITKMSSIRLGNLQASLPNISGIQAEFIQGITNNQIIILNVKNITSNKQILVNDSI